MKHRLVSAIKTFVKLLLTVALFAYIFGKIDFDAVFAKISRADIPLLLMALTLALLSTVLAAYRWKLVMTKLGLNEPFGFYLASYFKGSFFNQALPGSIGGDGVRLLNLKARGHTLGVSFHGIFIDRIVGLVGLLVINLAALAFLGGLLPWQIAQFITVICIIGLIGFGVLILLHKVSIAHRLPVVRVFAELSRSFYAVYDSTRAAASQIGLSVLVHLFSVLCVFALSRAVRLEYEIWIYCLMMPPVFLLMIVPLSLAGWGIRESAMVMMFGFLGADKAAILSVSLLYGAVVVVSSLPGLFVWLGGRERLL